MATHDETVTLADLQVGDYILTNEHLWKIIREVQREDGRWLGVKDAEGRLEKIHVTADPYRRVTRRLYGVPATMEAAVENVLKGIGGTILAEQRGPEWYHPPFTAFAADEALLRAHLVRFHDHRAPHDDSHEKLVAYHRSLHAEDRPRHTHNEGDPR